MYNIFINTCYIKEKYKKKKKNKKIFSSYVDLLKLKSIY